MRARGAILALAACLLPMQARAQGTQPLSAIDWLSDSVSAPGEVLLPAAPGLLPDEPGTAESVTTEPVSVMPLDRQFPDAVGLLPASATGFARDLWGPARPGDIARQIRNLPADMLPAMQDLLYLILLAELDPPLGAGMSGQEVFLARVDKLLELGALERAAALLERAGPAGPEIFRRAFDTALILGHEDRQCETMRATPTLSPTLPARIFCLARLGDWEAAALALEGGHALGEIGESEDELLARFLDPEPFEGRPAPPRPVPMTPLLFKLYEAAGEPVATGTLPLAFAQSDLRPVAGWKARIEAAERLARTGAIGANQLLGLYTERRAAASGGVWERVRAVQALERAVAQADREALEALLPDAWAQFRAAEIEVSMARLFGEELAGMGLSGEAGQIALEMGYLSDGYERLAGARAPADRREALLAAIARGDVSALTPVDPAAAPVIEAFRSRAVPARLKALVDQGRLGEAILRAMTLFTSGTQGDLDEIEDALTFLRAVGLESTARRAALEYLILERLG